MKKRKEWVEDIVMSVDGRSRRWRHPCLFVVGQRCVRGWACVGGTWPMQSLRRGVPTWDLLLHDCCLEVLNHFAFEFVLFSDIWWENGARALVLDHWSWHASAHAWFYLPLSRHLPGLDSWLSTPLPPPPPLLPLTSGQRPGYEHVEGGGQGRIFHSLRGGPGAWVTLRVYICPRSIPTPEEVHSII